METKQKKSYYNRTKFSPLNRKEKEKIVKEITIKNKNFKVK